MGQVSISSGAASGGSGSQETVQAGFWFFGLFVFFQKASKKSLLKYIAIPLLSVPLPPTPPATHTLGFNANSWNAINSFLLFAFLLGNTLLLAPVILLAISLIEKEEGPAERMDRWFIGVGTDSSICLKNNQQTST